MDDRKRSLFALALTLGLVGCVPNQNKVNTAQAPPPPSDLSEASEPRSLNPFAAAPKREPKLELDLAVYHQRTAAGLAEKPEQQNRELDLARRMYQEILIYDNKNLEGHRGLAQVYIAQREFDRAKATLQKAIDLHPKTAQLHADMSVIFSKQNDFPGAIQKLTKAREMEPENQEFTKMLGLNLVCNGQVDQGVDMLSRARGKASAHYYVARLLDRKNQFAEARRHAQLALETNPDFADARALLADLNQRGSQPMNPPANVALQFVSEE